MWPASQPAPRPASARLSCVPGGAQRACAPTCRAGAAFERIPDTGSGGGAAAFAQTAAAGEGGGQQDARSCASKAPCGGGPLNSAHGNLVGSSVLRESAYRLKYGARGSTMAFVASEPITGG